LRDQVETLSAELDASPYGVLNDYPGECYPLDVLMAVVCIRRADSVLGTDHSAFVRRAVRGFEGDLLDRYGLPPYRAEASCGIAFTTSRGCGNSYGCFSAPLIWPEIGARWYALYEEYFWQERYGLSGFSRVPEGVPGGA